MHADLSPTARALRTLEILQTRPGTTAEALASRLGVSERAARRYVAILREAGIPVESTRGPYGGYRLGGGRLPPVVFTSEEALSLVMTVIDGQPAASDATRDVVGTGLGKLIRALPASIGREAAALREHATAAPQTSARPDPVTTSALVAAVAARRRVVVGYRNESGREWESEVEPWAVVVRFGRWYLLCRSLRADAVRTYRVDRIRDVRRTEVAFEPPPDLDPVASLEENLGSGWEFPTRVVFEAPMAEVAPWIRPPMGQLEADGDRCVLVGTTSNPTMYAQEWLPRVPFAFHVEAGPELRAEVAKVAARFAGAVPESS